MANMIDYLNWRGDLTFAQSPMNEIDSLILANLSYVPFDSIVPSPWERERITLREASHAFWKEREEKQLLQEFSLIKMAPFAMRRLAETKRFGDLYLMKYQNSVSKTEESQFSALCIQMEDKKYYIAFRGTDDSMIGWKENFKMCFETVPAQRKAVDYLNYVGKTCNGPIWLGGHSKGGNLSVYAAAKAKPEVQNRIMEIYNFDGPGFSKKMLSSNGYQNIRQRIRKYVPTASFIGMLLEHDEEYTVVSSEGRGIMQHDPISWRVLGTRLIAMPKQKKDSRLMDQTLHDWIYSLSLEERKRFVTAFFHLVEESDIESLRDFGEKRWRYKLWNLQRSIWKNPDLKQMIKDSRHWLIEEFSRSLTPEKPLRRKKKDG